MKTSKTGLNMEQYINYVDKFWIYNLLKVVNGTEHESGQEFSDLDFTSVR